MTTGAGEGESDDTGGLIEREGRMHDDGGRQCRPG
jgi:hypothetical protein